MSDFEVSDPILNSPYEEPREHWWIEEGSAPQRREGRRPAMYFYREPKPRAEAQGRQGAEAIPLQLVNQIRDLVATWRHQGCPGASRTTHELLSWWRREGREKRAHACIPVQRSCPTSPTWCPPQQTPARSQRAHERGCQHAGVAVPAIAVAGHVGASSA